jgi:hypothetical protein
VVGAYAFGAALKRVGKRGSQPWVELCAGVFDDQLHTLCVSAGRAADTRRSGARSPAQAALVVGALGVVFGDIGTSPIYTIQTVFNPSDPHPIAVSSESVFGVVSLIFWSVTIIVREGAG